MRKGPMSEFALMDEKKGIPLFRPYVPLKAIDFVSDTLNSRWIGEGPKVKEFEIKFQKWEHFVINYENNIIDIFINGKLVASQKNIPDFMTDNKITIGEDNGIHGSIKDIYYYDIPKPKEQIELLHDIIKR